MIVFALLVLMLIVFYLVFFLVEIVSESYFIPCWAEFPTIILIVLLGFISEGVLINMIGSAIKTYQ
jgi:hypothetical protein